MYVKQVFNKTEPQVTEVGGEELLCCKSYESTAFGENKQNEVWFIFKTTHSSGPTHWKD